MLDRLTRDTLADLSYLSSYSGSLRHLAAHFEELKRSISAEEEMKTREKEDIKKSKLEDEIEEEDTHTLKASCLVDDQENQLNEQSALALSLISQEITYFQSELRTALSISAVELAQARLQLHRGSRAAWAALLAPLPDPDAEYTEDL